MTTLSPPRAFFLQNIFLFVLLADKKGESPLLVVGYLVQIIKIHPHVTTFDLLLFAKLLRFWCKTKAEYL